MKILGMGWLEIVIILAIVLIIFGPKQLPKLGRALGKTVKNLRKGMGSDEEAPAEDSAEVAIVAVESAPAAAAAEAPAAQPVAEAAEAAPKVVKKTVVKKKVE